MLPEPSSNSHSLLLLNLKNRRIIERIARKYTHGTPVIWEDAVQTAYMKVLEAIKAGRFRHGGLEEFYRWATVVARYEIIDFVRREMRRQCQSLDQIIPGTDLSILDTISDEFCLSDAIERADFVFQVSKIINILDQRHPERGYLKLWQGQVQGNKQAEIAVSLGVTQPEVSKRRKELVIRVACELGLMQPDEAKPEKQQKQIRKRTKTQWT